MVTSREVLVEALQKLIDAADDSDSACYGTLSTQFVRQLCKDTLHLESKIPTHKKPTWIEDVYVNEGTSLRQLLKKYVAYVYACEGVSFLDHYRGYEGDPVFTATEWAELQKIEDEVRKELV